MPTNKTATMDTPGVRELLEEHPGTRLIDVRTPGEFAASHIPGSANVPIDVLRAGHSELTVTHTDPIVLICGSGARAEQARTMLDSTAPEQLTVLQGGITGWQQHDAPLEHGSGAWAMERQVRLTAGLLVLTGVLGSTAYRPLKWLAGFVGGGLTVAALTDTCAMSRILGLLPHNRTRSPDRAGRLEALTDGPTGPRS